MYSQANIVQTVEGVAVWGDLVFLWSEVFRAPR